MTKDQLQAFIEGPTKGGWYIVNGPGPIGPVTCGTLEGAINLLQSEIEHCARLNRRKYGELE